MSLQKYIKSPIYVDLNKSFSKHDIVEPCIFFVLFPIHIYNAFGQKVHYMEEKSKSKYVNYIFNTFMFNTSMIYIYIYSNNILHATTHLNYLSMHLVQAEQLAQVVVINPFISVLIKSQLSSLSFTFLPQFELATDIYLSLAPCALINQLVFSNPLNKARQCWQHP